MPIDRLQDDSEVTQPRSVFGEKSCIIIVIEGVDVIPVTQKYHNDRDVEREDRSRQREISIDLFEIICNGPVDQRL
jgi:hypothetical protein